MCACVHVYHSQVEPKGRKRRARKGKKKREMKGPGHRTDTEYLSADPRPPPAFSSYGRCRCFKFFSSFPQSDCLCCCLLLIACPSLTRRMAITHRRITSYVLYRVMDR